MKSQRWVREVYAANYSLTTASPDAYAHDDEDQGQMGALSALMAMGLFQLRGGCEVNPSYELTAPMLDRVVVHLQPDCYQAKDLGHHRRPGSRPESLHPVGDLNGQPLTRLAITQEQIRQGARLDFVLSATPNPAWTDRAK